MNGDSPDLDGCIYGDVIEVMVHFYIFLIHWLESQPNHPLYWRRKEKAIKNQRKNIKELAGERYQSL